MAYAILRTQKLKSSDLGGVNAHNSREMEVPNADKNKQDLNKQIFGSLSLQDDIEKRLEETGITKHKKDAVLGIEHMMTASPEFFADGNSQKWQKFENECMNWLSNQYGKDNIVNVHIHKDEKTPHIHAIVTPIREKEVKWKNKAGEGFKIQNRLCAKDFLNGKERLSRMQDSFAQHLAKSGLELKRGAKNSKAKHEEIQKYYTGVKEGLSKAQKVDELGIEKNWIGKEKLNPDKLKEEFKEVFMAQNGKLLKSNAKMIAEQRRADKFEELSKKQSEEIVKLKKSNTGLKKEVMQWKKNALTFATNPKVRTEENIKRLEDLTKVQKQEVKTEKNRGKQI